MVEKVNILNEIYRETLKWLKFEIEIKDEIMN